VRNTVVTLVVHNTGRLSKSMGNLRFWAPVAPKPVNQST